MQLKETGSDQINESWAFLPNSLTSHYSLILTSVQFTFTG